MKNRSLVMLALLAIAGLAQAHTHLESAMPADNAVLAEPPANIMLHFSEPTRLTALSVQKEGEKAQQSVGPLPTEASAALSVPIAALAPGKYAVNWRAVGRDNHIMSGVLHFTVNAP